MLVQQSTIGLLGRLCGYTRVLKEHSGGCAGTAEYHRNTRGLLEQSNIGALGRLVQQSTIRALRRLCWYSRVLNEHSEYCTGRAEYYSNTLGAVLVQQRILGAL